MTIRTEYTVRAIDNSVDARAAADACNPELMAAGDAYSLQAAEDKAKECAVSLRDALKIESADYEVWRAWEDGEKGDAVEFLVPLDGNPHDVADIGARALGVDVSERLNVEAV